MCRLHYAKNPLDTFSPGEVANLLRTFYTDLLYLETCQWIVDITELAGKSSSSFCWDNSLRLQVALITDQYHLSVVPRVGLDLRTPAVTL